MNAVRKMFFTNLIFFFMFVFIYCNSPYATYIMLGIQHIYSYNGIYMLYA